jgi:hypothetical protein
MKMRNRRTGIMPKIAITEDVVLSDKRNRQINNFPPDQIFQFHGHISPITGRVQIQKFGYHDELIENQKKS